MSDRSCVLLELPEPAAPPEAHYIAVVEHPDDAPLAPGRESERCPLRYFTLEAGPRGGPRTFLCEWTARERHLNLAEGPEPDARAFLRALAARIRLESGDSETPSTREVELERQARTIPLPGPFELDGVTVGDLLDDLAASEPDLDLIDIAYFADPERMIGRPWQIEVLRTMGPDLVPVLVESLRHDDRCAGALFVLATLELDSRLDPGSLASAERRLLPLLSSPRSLIRALSAEALGTLASCTPAAIAALMESLYDDEPRVRRGAVAALGRMERRPPDVLAALRGRRDDDDSAVRTLLAHYLGADVTPSDGR